MGVLRSESRPTHNERMTAGLRDEPTAPEVGLEYTEPQSCGFLLKASLEGTLPPPKHLMETSGMFLEMDFLQQTAEESLLLSQVGCLKSSYLWCPCAP